MIDTGEFDRLRRARRRLRIGLYLVAIGSSVLIGILAISISAPIINRGWAPPGESSTVLIAALAGLISAVAGLITALTGLLTLLQQRAKRSHRKRAGRKQPRDSER